MYAWFMDSAHNNQVHAMFRDILNGYAEIMVQDNPPVCEHCTDQFCEGGESCWHHPDRVAVRDAKAKADAIWNARFAKAQDAGKYGEEL